MILQRRKTYSFRTLAPAILGAEFKNVTLASTEDYQEAIKRDNVDIRFKTIYPLLNPKPVNDPTACDYHVFRTEQGNVVVLSEWWIDMSSVVEVSGENWRVAIHNTDANSIKRLESAIKALGFKDYTIERS